jgi:amino acid adenylation domain-containing protein/non-ribosomal peptide synthase protein (TIGR01720 family)
MMLGPLTNTLPALVKVCDERVTQAWLRELQIQQISLRQYAYSSLAQIRKWISQPGDLPLFESRLILDSDSVDAFSRRAFRALGIYDGRYFADSGLPLSIEMLSVSDPTIRITYHHHHFDDVTIGRILRHLETILAAIGINPETKIGALPLLSQAERDEILIDWNRTESEYESLRCIHELIENCVVARPDAIAVRHEEEEISYRELNRRSNQLAHYLKELGAGPEIRVGICLDRNILMMEAVLGVLKAGAAYVPLDPAYPLERLMYMSEDAQVLALISEQKFVERFHAYSGRIISIDTDRETISRYGVEDSRSGATAENLAYIIYTSGSTGQPKGVGIGHRSLVNLVTWHQSEFQVSSEDKATQIAAFGFDASVWEIWPYLTAGARICIVPEETRKNPRELPIWLERNEVTIGFLPTPLAEAMLGEEWPAGLRMREILTGGDRLRRTAIEERRVSLINNYGPTENTVVTTSGRVEEGEGEPSIGRPIQNTQVYILDEQRRPLPVGVSGELYISGAGLARGYMDRPDMTAERFTPNPFSRKPGERVYGAGDICRYLPNGSIDFIGRKDNQIKLKGNRIELGEIEAVLSKHSSVREAVVIASDGEAGDKRLNAYIVSNRDQDDTGRIELSVKSLRSYLWERLPEYMIPTRFTIVDSIPLTPNGKIDRKRLLIVEDASRQLEQEPVAPRTPEEGILAGIFKEALKLDRVGIHDNFFELGGDSILSIRIISRANEAGLGLTPKQLFLHQNIAELAAVAGNGGMIEFEQGNVAGEVPLTPIQEWFFEGNDQEPEHFNQAVMLEAREELDLKALGDAVRQLVKQHDALRHRFLRGKDGWRQVCEEIDRAVALEERDLSGIAESLESKVIEEAAAEYQKGMNLGEGPLLRVVVFGGKGRRQRVLIVGHHLVIDGVSWWILLGDLERGYEQSRRGEEIRLGAKTTSYKRWAERLKDEAQSERSREEAKYWLAEGEKRVREFPVDHSGANTVASSRSVVVSLNEEETTGLLQEVAREYKTQINEVLLSAVVKAISEWSGERTVLLEMEGHGREEIVKDVDLTRTVGWFTTLYPVRVELRGANSVELLRNVKEGIREASSRGIYYGMLKYLCEDSDLRERLRALPQPGISFNYFGQLDLVLKEGSLFHGAKESAGESRSQKENRRHLIEINGSVIGRRLQLVWTYSENVHRKQTIEVVAERAMEVLREVIAGSKSSGERPYTPSDFPLARLSQQKLDQLLSAGKDIEDIYALSPLQKGMLFHTLSGLNQQALFLQLTCDLRGTVDFSAFKKAWRRLVERHSILRTAFEWEDLEEPVQVTHRRVEMPIAYHDWASLTREEQNSRFEELLQADREQGFDLSNPPLMRLSLIRLAGDLYRLIWSHHHLLLDGWSAPLILREVMAFYEAYEQGAELAPAGRAPYREYIAWLKRQDLQKAEGYWREKLSGFSRPTRLWIDRGTGRLSSREAVYEDQQTVISGEAAAKLQAFARQRRLTLNTILQGAWGVLLGKYSGEEDIAFGTTVSGRPVDLPGSETIIGPFINTLPVRMKIPLRSSLLSWLSELQSDQIEYGHYAYSSLVEQYSEIPLGVPLYESILVFENYPVDRSSEDYEHRVEISDVHSPVRTKFPLTIVSGPGSELPLSIAYDSRRFRSQDISRLLSHLRNIIEGMANSPERPIWSLSPWSRTEQNQLLSGWKGVERIDADNSYIHHRFETQAKKNPDAIAVVFEQEQISYRELNTRANQLATYLQRQRVGPEVSVGVSLEPSLALVVVVLGILKASGTCATLDQSDHGLDFDWEAIGRQSGTNPDSRVMDENLAFIISTSGSAGEPKRVMITHRGLRNQLLGMQEIVSLTEEDRVLHRRRSSIDVSTLEVLWPLLAGARLVIAGPEACRNHDSILELIVEQQITTADFTPSIFLLLRREERLDNCGSLRRIMLNGETLSRSILERSYGRLNMDLYHLYCVSEATGAVTGQVCGPQHDSEIVTAGQPLINTQIYILDSYLQPAPSGVAGEIWINGEGLARGYSGQADLTAERFIPNPFSSIPGERMLRTEDIARCQSDGKVEVLSRRENQIKTRFSRIEPAQIESALMESSEIDQAALLLVENGLSGARLTAYLGCNNGGAPSAEELRRHLRSRFPAQMMPSAFVMMKTLPLTLNDRVDRKALAAMTLDPPDGEIGLADNGAPYEEMLRSIWSELFGVDEVSREDNFFEMGGHSLLATQFISRVRDVLKLEIPLRSVFEEPTIGGFARRIEKAIRAGETEDAPPLAPVSRERGLPLSFAQQRLWFLAQLAPNSPLYNSPGAVSLEGRLDYVVLERVINEILRRHEVLRTRIEAERDTPTQVIDEWEHRRLEVEDLTSVPREEREAAAGRIASAETKTGFDLSRGPLLRVKLLKLEEERHVLLYTMHHIVTDGWSMGILIREVGALYQAFRAGERSPLEELPIQYADFAVWQREWLQGAVLERKLAYWRKQLAGVETLELPTDYPRPAAPTYRGSVQRFVVESSVAEQLREMSRREGMTLFMTLLGGFDVSLSRYSGQEDVTIGTDIANRNRAETEGLIGFFVNQLVLRVEVRTRESFRDLLKRVREACLGAYAHQDVPFEKLVEELQPDRDLSRSPLFQIKLVLQNTPRGTLELNEMMLSGAGDDVETASEVGTSRFDLTVSIAEVGLDGGHGLAGVVEYSRDLFEPETIERLMSHYTNVLREIVEKGEKPVCSLSLLSVEERKQIVVEWNATERPYPQDQCIHELFRKQVARSPERIALVSEGRWVSYQELNRRANQLAAYLQRLGVGPEVVVGLCLERSVEMIVAMMGALKAGGAYLPLDPEYPLERLALMLEDAGVGVALTDRKLEGRLPAYWGQVVRLDLEWEKITGESEEEPSSEVVAENLAYVIYTSGSTGRPKGVMAAHKGLCNLVRAQKEPFRLGDQSRVLQFASSSFDASVSEIFGALAAGGSLHLYSQESLTPGSDLVRVLREDQITTVTLPPTVLAMLEREELIHLNTIIAAGEACAAEIGERWAKGRRFLDAYGPTEATVCASIGEWAGGLNQKPTIGRPIANTQLYILDRELEPVPVGAPGELYLGGAGVARGYLGRPEVTAERFIPNNFSREGGERLYRTADVGRYFVNGEIDFIGRADSQMKLRGYRIEPGEVETVLREQPGVRQAVVVAREDAPGQKRLVAYVVTDAIIKATTQNEVELWPSVAEYFVYDDALYYAMTHDERRNLSYRIALDEMVMDKVVLDIGTGADAILARMCVEAGAKKVYAIELLDESYRRAKTTLSRLGLDNQIELTHGDSTKVQLPERVDICVSEIVGSIGGCEGAGRILNDARRFLKSSGAMIPCRSTTLIAGARLPERLRSKPQFSAASGYYAEKIFEQLGYPFDLRVCVKNFPIDHVISDHAIFEDLDFNRGVPDEESHEISLTISEHTTLDGFLIWLNLYTTPDEVIDILKAPHSWLPVFFPVFYPGLEVWPGDRIKAVCGRRLCAENQINPDYQIEGKVIRRVGDEVNFCYQSPHFQKSFKSIPFYKALFDGRSVVEIADNRVAKSVSVELRSALENRLPNYMVPNAIVLLERLPMTPNGKLDYNALPAPEFGGSGVEKGYVGGWRPVEEILLGIFEDILKIDGVGRADNFFELGGHSLLATQVVSRVRDIFGLEMGVKSIFEEGTIERLALRVEEAMRAGDRDEAPPLVKVLREGESGRRLPLSFAQQRLWFIDQLEPGSPVYNIPGAVWLDGELDLEVLESVINEIVRRHEILRTRIEVVEGEPVQVIDEWEPRRLEVEDLSIWPQEEIEEEVRRRARAEARTGFDLSRGPLFRVKVIKLEEGRHVVLYTMHHIVSDGWSSGILVGEVDALYQAYSMGKESPLPELPIQYADFAVWQRGWLQGEVLENQLAYWRAQLGGDLPALELPTDRPRPARETHRGAQHSQMLPATLSDSLKALTLKQNCTMFMTLLTAFKILLYYLTGETDICVGVDIANRNRAGTERLIGFFVNQLVLRSNLIPVMTFEELLRNERESMLQAYVHQDLPFEKLVEALNPARHENRTPLFQVKMALQNVPMMLQNATVEGGSLPRLGIGQIEADTGRSKFDLLLDLQDTEEGLAARLQYKTDLFEERTAVHILNRFHTLLERIVERPDSKLQALVESLAEEENREQLERKSELESVRLRKLKSIKRRTLRETRAEEEQ